MDIYTLHFIIETVTGEETQSQNVTKILHNGTATGKTDASAFPEAKLHSAFSEESVIDTKWAYSYRNGTETVSAEVSANDLLTAILNAPDKTDITVRPVLKAKS